MEIPAWHSPEAEESCAVGGVGEDVEKSQDSEWDNILDVVLVSSPHPLNILVCAALEMFGPSVLSGGSYCYMTYLGARLLGILRRDECHRLEPLPGRQERHDYHLQDRDGGIEGVRLE